MSSRSTPLTVPTARESKHLSVTNKKASLNGLAFLLLRSGSLFHCALDEVDEGPGRSGVTVKREQVPAYGPREGLAGLEAGVRSLGFQLDEGLACIDIDLDLSLLRGGLGAVDVLEALDQYEPVMGVCVPAGAVGVDLAVGAGLVHLIP